MPDALVLLRQDHKEVEKLFKQYEKLGKGAPAQRRKIVDEIIEKLAVHSSIEEQFFYPAVREKAPEVADVVLEGLEEHHVVKWVLSELEGMQPDDERFHPKVTVLMENVRHHVEEEEEDMFPEVRKAMGRKALAELGDLMEKGKAVAPTRPHPRAPDTPPANLVAGPTAAAADSARDVVRRTVRKAVRRG